MLFALASDLWRRQEDHHSLPSCHGSCSIAHYPISGGSHWRKSSFRPAMMLSRNRSWDWRRPYLMRSEPKRQIQLFSFSCLLEIIGRWMTWFSSPTHAIESMQLLRIRRTPRVLLGIVLRSAFNRVDKFLGKERHDEPSSTKRNRSACRRVQL